MSLVMFRYLGTDVRVVAEGNDWCSCVDLHPLLGQIKNHDPVIMSKTSMEFTLLRRWCTENSITVNGKKFTRRNKHEEIYIFKE